MRKAGGKIAAERGSCQAFRDGTWFCRFAEFHFAEKQAMVCFYQGQQFKKRHVPDLSVFEGLSIALKAIGKLADWRLMAVLLLPPFAAGFERLKLRAGLGKL